MVSRLATSWTWIGGVVLQSELQAGPPMSLKIKGHFHLSAISQLSFLGILAIHQMITLRVESFLG